jgi:hypothetical protein
LAGRTEIEAGASIPVGAKIPTDADLGRAPDEEDAPVMFVFGDDDRDITRPLGKDTNGNPLYAPRGKIIRFGRAV